MCSLQKGTEAKLSCSPGASMMQQTIVVSSSRMAYINLHNTESVILPSSSLGTDLEAMLLLQLLGQHWQMAQAAEPKQQAAVLAREMMAPILQSHRFTV